MLSSTSSVTTSCSSQDFLPLENGIAPFPLKRAVVIPQPSFSINYDYDADDDSEGDSDNELDDDAPSKLAMKLRVATNALGRLTHALRRRSTRPARITESVVLTSPDNWRPGLVTLEQAACRADIVRRPESFERRRA